MMALDKDGTLEAVALTDGTATITNGAISSVTTLTATTLTDGTESITGGKYTTTVAATGGGDTNYKPATLSSVPYLEHPSR